MNILISRTKRYIDRIRLYKLYVDEEYLVEIKNSEDITIQISKNAKKLVAKIDWCESLEFDLTTLNENEKIEIYNPHFKKAWIPFYILFIIFFRKNSYLKIEKI